MRGPTAAVWLLGFCAAADSLHRYCQDGSVFWPQKGHRLGAYSFTEATTRFQYIGGGAFTWVYKARYDGRGAVFKYSQASNSHQTRALAKELRILRLFARSPDIVRMYTCVVEGAQLGVVLERLDYTLEEMIPTLRGYGFPFRLNIYLALSRAYASLHRSLVYHNDIKPSNVMLRLRPRVQVKVIDFNTSCFAQELSAGGTLPLSSPEKIPAGRQCYCSEAVDVWAFLITMAIVESGRSTEHFIAYIPPHCFKSYMDQECYNQTVATVRWMLAHSPSAFRAHIFGWLTYHPQQRPRMDDIHQALLVLQQSPTL